MESYEGRAHAQRRDVLRACTDQDPSDLFLSHAMSVFPTCKDACDPHRRPYSPQGVLDLLEMARSEACLDLNEARALQKLEEATEELQAQDILQGWMQAPLLLGARHISWWHECLC